MRKFAALTFASLASLALAACGNSESAKEEAMADNVEMPAEERVDDLPADATPAPDASGAAGAEAATSETPKP
jgi:hypothetical protein